MVDDTKNTSYPAYRWLNKDPFMQVYGEVYENTVWIVEEAFDAGRLPSFMDESSRMHHPVPETLAEAESIAGIFSATLGAATTEQKLALIRAHPDLVGRAAVAGELGKDSALEQSSAGLDQCTPDEYNRFQEANAQYWSKFDFPFVMAVRGADRQTILNSFEQRLQNDKLAEFETAIVEINKIALLRIIAMMPA